MVLRSRLAVILFLCCLLRAEASNNYPLSCRYVQLLAAYKKNFDFDIEEGCDIKFKKKDGTEFTRFILAPLTGNKDTHDAVRHYENDNRRGRFLTNHEFDQRKTMESKRDNNLPIISCDCKIKNDLLDLGHLHYPRYLLNAVCQKDHDSFEETSRCWRGTQCRPLEYKVRVLTYRSHNDRLQKDPGSPLLPDVLRSFWKFKTVTVAAGCFCA